MANILGTLGDDLIFGDINGIPENDTILGQEGNDQIFAGGGDDAIDADEGDDFVDGAAGNDFVSGGRGIDNIRGGDGRDELYGGADNDILDGGTGNDILYGDDAIGSLGGDDVLNGGIGNDKLYGGLGSDSVDGGDGDDLVHGDAGNDTVTGGFGSDFLSGGTLGSGDDILNSHATNVSGGFVERDEMFGGDGADTFNLRSDYIAGLASNRPVRGSGYAIIVDFYLFEGDKLNLLGPRANYKLEYGNANDQFIGSGGFVADTFILRQGNLVAVVLDRTLALADLGQVA